MYNLLTFFARISYRLGAKDPIESAIMLITVMQVSALTAGIGLLKIRWGIHVTKLPFMLVGAVLAIFNLWYLNKRAHTAIGQTYKEEVNYWQVVAGIILYFSLSLGVVWVVALSVKFIKP